MWRACGTLFPAPLTESWSWQRALDGGSGRLLSLQANSHQPGITQGEHQGCHV